MLPPRHRHLLGGPEERPPGFSRFVRHGGRLYVSSVTVGELMTWVSRAGAPVSRRDDFEAFIASVPVLDYSVDIARRLGEVRALLFDQGRPAPDIDLMIALTALHHGLTLVAHNVRHYGDVPGLSIEDWLTP